MRLISRGFLLLLLSAVLILPISTQDDGLNLPTELYILLNTGVVERYGLGTAGVQSITPAESFVLDFGISPSGEWLAYRTETELVLTNRLVGLGQRVAIDEGEADAPPVRGQGETLVWAPNGRDIAYTTAYGARIAFDVGTFPSYAVLENSPLVNLVWSPDGSYLAAEAENDVWWVYRRDGTALALQSAIPASLGTTWLDDTRLIFAPPTGGLLLMDMANQNAQTVLLDDGFVYSRPYLRPDDTLVAFVRGVNESELEANAGFLREMQMTTGQPAQASVLQTSEVAVDLTGARWAPQGQLMLSFRGGSLFLVLPGTGQGFPLPITNAAAYGWGAERPETITGVNLPRDGYFRAPTSDGLLQVWQLPADGLPAQPVTSAGADVTAYAVGLGDTIAYVSDGQLWRQDEALTTIPGQGIDPAFDPAGQNIIYAVLPSQPGADPVQMPEVTPEMTPEATPEATPEVTPEMTTGDNTGIWLYMADTGEAALVLPNELDAAGQPVFLYREPVYAPNVNAVLVKRITGDVVDYYLLDPTSGDVLTIGQYDDARWLADGRIVATRQEGTDSGIYVIDPVAEPIEAAVLLRASAARVMAVQPINEGRLRALLLGQSQPGRPTLNIVEFGTTAGEPDEIGGLSYLANATLSPDGSIVAGYFQPEGTLAFYSLTEGRRVLLRTPGEIEDFSFR